MRFVAALIAACLLVAGGPRAAETRIGEKPSQIDVAPTSTVTAARRVAAPDLRPNLIAIASDAPRVVEPPRIAIARATEHCDARIESTRLAVSSRGPPSA